jgi:GGDEF domain-containing protein
MDLEAQPLSGVALRALRGALRGRHRALKTDFGSIAFDGHVFPLMVEDGEIAGAVAVGVDTSEAHSAVLFLSTHDPLTGLLNRHQLLEVLRHSAAAGAAGGALVRDTIHCRI